MRAVILLAEYTGRAALMVVLGPGDLQDLQREGGMENVVHPRLQQGVEVVTFRLLPTDADVEAFFQHCLAGNMPRAFVMSNGENFK